MNLQPDTLLIASLAKYAIGAEAELLFLRQRVLLHHRLGNHGALGVLPREL
jgi:hypothetical protein